VSLSGGDGPLQAFGQLPSYPDAGKGGHLPSLRKASPDCSKTVPADGSAAVGEVISSTDSRGSSDSRSSSESRAVAAPSSAWRQF
jgi:hypothetical protein